MPVNPECILKTPIRLERLIKLQQWKVFEWSQGGYSDWGETRQCFGDKD